MGGLLGSLAGATPWGAIGQAALGIGQAVGGFIQQRKATKDLERMQSPTYNQNQSVLDYYSKALQRYNVNPESTNLYKMQQNNIQRNLASGISTLKSLGNGTGGVNNLIQGANDSSLQAQVEAEKLRRQDFGQLAGATNMKAGEDRMAFNINQEQPFERKYNLKALKASGGTSIANAGISNIFGGLQSADQANMLNQMYGNNGYGSSAALGGSGMGAASYGNNVLQQLYRNQNRRVG